MNAIEIIEEEVPEWQKNASLKRLLEMKAKADSSIEEEQFFNMLNEDEN